MKLIEGVPIATPTIRSTETRIECWMEWFLELIYEDYPDKTFYALGTGLHKAIENIIDGVPYDVAKDLLDEYLFKWTAANWGEDVIQTKSRSFTDIMAQAPELLSKWYMMAHPDGKFQASELSDLSWPPATEVVLEFTTSSGHTQVRTEMDALYYRGGQPVIVDWKTGASKSGDDRQLHVYWYGAVRSDLIDPDAEFEGYFGYVDHQEVVPTKLVYPGHYVMGMYIDEMERRRRSRSYVPVPSWKCKYCSVRTVCPVWADNDAEEWDTLLDKMNLLRFDGEDK